MWAPRLNGPRRSGQRSRVGARSSRPPRSVPNNACLASHHDKDQRTMNAIATVDERNISQPINWVKAQRANAVVAALQRRHFKAQYVAGRAEALAAILALVPDGASVFRADPVT